MNYSLDQLQTIASCDVLLNLITKEKELAASKLGILKASIDRHGEISVGAEAELNDAIAAREAYMATLATLTEGTESYDQIASLKDKADVRIRTLQKRTVQYTEEDLLLKQLEYKRMENDLPLYDELVMQVEGHKATL